jgi:hypothetical protein
MTDRVNIFVTGKTYDKCPEDSCTIVNVKHYEHLKDAILKWRPDGYVTIFYKDNNAMKAMPLHRYVVGVLEGKEIPVNHVVHHKVPNRYDNDINNLEVVTYAQNNAAIVRPKKSSETIFKGIYFCKLQNAWVAMINYKRRAYNLGAFLNETEAALKYDSAFYAIYRSKI